MRDLQSSLWHAKSDFLNWRLSALQYCAGFCPTTTQISHNFLYIYIYTHILSLFSLSPRSHPTPLGHHRAPAGFPVLYSIFPLVLFAAFELLVAAMRSSSLTVNRTWAPCTGLWSLSHWTTREVQNYILKLLTSKLPFIHRDNPATWVFRGGCNKA